MVHIPNVFCGIQFINCVGIFRINRVFCTVIIRFTETFWLLCNCVDLFKPTAFCWFVLISRYLYTKKPLDEKCKESSWKAHPGVLSTIHGKHHKIVFIRPQRLASKPCLTSWQKQCTRRSVYISASVSTGKRSKTYCGCVKPRITPKAIYNMIFV
jgi:hypothetical protein